MSSTTTLILELLEQSRQLSQGILCPGLPQIQYGLDELRQHCRELCKRENVSEIDTKAHYLLAGSGVNAEKMSKHIYSIKLDLVDQALNSPENDVDTYLRHSRDQSMLAIMDQRRQQSQIEFKAYMNKQLKIDWESRKRKFFADLRSKAGKNIANEPFTNAELSPQVSVSRKVEEEIIFEDIGLLGQALDQTDISIQSRQRQYASAVKLLNDSRLKKEPVNISSLFGQTTQNNDASLSNHKIADCWQILSFITHESYVEHGRSTSGQPIAARALSKPYIDVSNSKDHIALCRRISTSSRRYLEHQFFTIIEREIIKNPQEARLGGIPSVESKIKAYVNMRFSKHGKWTTPNLQIINNVPMWAIIFLLIRAGFVDEALQYTIKNESSLEKVEKNWPTYMRAFASSKDRRLPSQLQDRLHAEYNHRVKFSIKTSDPYKHGLYKIIGRCDLSRRVLPDILNTTEDWMWLQLALVREMEDEAAAFDKFSLADLQATVVKFGARHFNPKDTNPILYFQILLLSGQFERAVHYLSSVQLLEGIHFAIALVYTGLLRTAVNIACSNQLLSMDEHGLPSVDFVSLMRLYSRQLRQRDPVAAVEYLCLICLSNDLVELAQVHTKICHESVRELVLKTRDFAILLGDVRADGSRAPGIIEQRMGLLELSGENEYLHKITEQAASQADQEGSNGDAILLYHLSERYDTVVTLINAMLGDAVSDSSQLQTSISSSATISLTAIESPTQLAQKMISIYSSNAGIYRCVSKRNRDACDLLLRMLEAKEQYHLQKYEPTLAIIEQLGIIPLDEDTNIGTIRKRAQDFDLMDDSVARNVPGILLIAIDSLKQLYGMLKQSQFTYQTRLLKLSCLKKKAKTGVLFAGMIRFRMDADLYAKLVDIW